MGKREAVEEGEGACVEQQNKQRANRRWGVGSVALYSNKGANCPMVQNRSTNNDHQPTEHQPTTIISEPGDMVYGEYTEGKGRLGEQR